MNSSIPSSWGSTREQRCASGGPWCSCSCVRVRRRAAMRRASIRRPALRLGCVGEVDDDVLDRAGGRAAGRARRVSREPARAHPRQRRDDDLVDAEELQRVHHRGVGIGVADHAGGDDARARASASSSALEAARAPRARGALAAVLRDDDDEAVGPSAARRLSALEQRLAADRLVGDHERHVERQALGVEVDDDVLDRQAGRLLHALDQVAPQPAGARRRVASRR